MVQLGIKQEREKEGERETVSGFDASV